MTDTSSKSATRELLAAEPSPAFVPNRFREPLYHVEENAMGEDFGGAIGKWLHGNRDKFVRGGDEHGVLRFNYELCDIDKYMPTELIAPFKKKLIKAVSDPAVLKALNIPEFDLRYIEIHATNYHHGSHFVWHDDAPGYDGELVPTRRATFCYYMHSNPKMFSGGELEFLDGTAVEPVNDRLAMFHPIQQHRVKRVECWSNAFLHGRWALMGWVHGDAPEGWVERMPTMRGIPAQG